MSVIERILDKDIGGQLGMVQIATAELRTADPQFTGLTVGHLLAVRTDNIQAVCTGSLTDRHIRLIAFHGVTCYHTTTLRRTIDVQECQTCRWCHRFQFLTADREETQRRTVVQRDKLTARHGTHDDMRDGIVIDEL